MQFKVGYWLQITDLCAITCFNSSLSFMYFSAVWLAFSACAWRAAVVPDADASWLIRVISRFITLQKHTKVRGKPGSKSRCCIRADSQPQEDGKTRDVQIPLGSKKLHVQVVEHIWLQLGIGAVLFRWILSHFTDSIFKNQRKRNPPISPKVALKIQTGMIVCLPRKRTMSIMIMVRNTLFQNLDIQLQILRWKMLCHLHKHLKSHHYGAQHNISYRITTADSIFDAESNTTLCCQWWDKPDTYAQCRHYSFFSV